MDRLTKTDTNEMICRYEDCDTEEENCPYINLNSGNCECLKEVIKKLAHYEELAKQGRLMELPCKVGDTIYKICPINKSIQMGDMRNGRIVKSDCQRCPYGSCDCSNIGFRKDSDNVIREVIACDEDWILNRRKHFGKVYFLTKTEAKQALANMNKLRI